MAAPACRLSRLLAFLDPRLCRSPLVVEPHSAEVTWNEWEEILAALPTGPLRERLVGENGVHRELDRTRLSEALKAGVSIAGARLVRGQHVRVG